MKVANLHAEKGAPRCSPFFSPAVQYALDSRLIYSTAKFASALISRCHKYSLKT
jgi:hypothetical protein